MTPSYRDRREPGGYRERLDPGGEVEQMARFLGSPLARLIMRMSGKTEEAQQARELLENYQRLADTPDEVAETLHDLGWIIFGLAPAKEYAEAAELVRAGKSEEAEALLEEAWNDGNTLAFLNRVIAVYRDHPDDHAIGLARLELVREAIELHREEHYAGAILIGLSQIDGIVFDMTGEAARGFFARAGKGEHLVDETTLAGHPRGLAVLNRMFNKGMSETGWADDLRRHGVVHGRQLGYANRRSSTKVLVMLLNVIEWAQAIGAMRTAEAIAEREARYAGRTDVDEDGRRLDRRGFKEGKFLLQDIQLYEHGFFKNNGRYTEHTEDFPLGDTGEKALSLPGAALKLVASPDAFHAWYVTPTGFVFGVASAGGDYNESWKFAGETAPTGGPGEDDRWRHAANDPAHVEW